MMHNTRSRPSLCKKNEKLLVSASHAGGPASMYHPSGSIDISKTSSSRLYRETANIETFIESKAGLKDPNMPQLCHWSRCSVVPGRDEPLLPTSPMHRGKAARDRR